jgi:hypothetical protein
MPIKKYSGDYTGAVRALRVQYIRDFLICGWNALLGFFRLTGQVSIGRVTDRRNPI